MMIIDAEDAILGRLAAKIAKELLRGEQVVVVNAEKVVISGNPKAVIERYSIKRKRGDIYKGPFYPRYPDKLLRRVVRGMLPYKKERGMKALRRLRVFMGNPENLNGEKISKTAEELKCKYITLRELCKRLGAKID